MKACSETPLSKIFGYNVGRTTLNSSAWLCKTEQTGARFSSDCSYNGSPPGREYNKRQKLAEYRLIATALADPFLFCYTDIKTCFLIWKQQAQSYDTGLAIQGRTCSDPEQQITRQICATTTQFRAHFKNVSRSEHISRRIQIQDSGGCIWKMVWEPDAHIVFLPFFFSQ